MNPKDCRILISSESSHLKTGFALIARELLTRLWNAGYTNLAEIASYFDERRPLDQNHYNSVPWKFFKPYPNNVNPDEFNSRDIEFQFNKGVFDEVCLDFQPDIVIEWRDIWMSDWINRSVWRDKFKFIVKGCVDSDPLPAYHLNSYKKADLNLAYTAYGKYVLETQSNIKVYDICRCGVKLDIFKPKDRKATRAKYGLNPDVVIFGTVCRNQPRKRLARYFDSIKLFLKKYSTDNANTTNNTYFLFHTSSPDCGINIPEHIARTGIGKHLIFTYSCQNCGQFKILPYQGEHNVPCENCRGLTCQFPSTGIGITTEQLSDVYALMDYYVQPSIAGSPELPILEAKAVGIPVVSQMCAGMAENVAPLDEFVKYRSVENSIDYVPPTSEQIEYWGDAYLGGIQMPIETFWWDEVIEVRRHLFDWKKLSSLIFELCQKRHTEWYNNKCKEARYVAEKYHNWDDTFNKWIGAINHVAETVDRNKTWDAPIEFLPLPNYDWKQLDRLNNQEFLDHCLRDLLRDPIKIGGNEYWKIIDGLEHGRMLSKPKSAMCAMCSEKYFMDKLMLSYLQPVNRELLWQSTLNGINISNQWRNQLKSKKEGGGSIATNKNSIEIIKL